MIEPMDLRTQSFKKGLFGYKTTDVDTYVETAYRAYDEAYNENRRLKDEVERLNKVIEENRVKLFDLENKVQRLENVSTYKSTADTKKAEAPKPQPETVKPQQEAPKPQPEAPKPQPEAPKAEEKSATSKFFQQAEAKETVAMDDDEVFVGEIEDNRKPAKAMIGDGENTSADDFEFL